MTAEPLWRGPLGEIFYRVEEAMRAGLDIDGELEVWPVGDRTPADDRIKRLEEAILDIDAHAAPLGEDEDGFVSVGYTVSVGALHRALGVVGRTAPKRGRIRPAAGDRTPVTREQIEQALVGCVAAGFERHAAHKIMRLLSGTEGTP